VNRPGAIKVTQYYPSFFEGFNAWSGEVGTLEELLAIGFIARWTEMPEFYRFSLHRHYVPQDHFGPNDPPENISLLMAELKGGREWWVVAKLEGEDLNAFGRLSEFAPSGNGDEPYEQEAEES
jgi:hypothetical protein